MPADLPTGWNLNRIDSPQNFLACALKQLAETVKQPFRSLLALDRFMRFLAIDCSYRTRATALTILSYRSPQSQSLNPTRGTARCVQVEGFSSSGDLDMKERILRHLRLAIIRGRISGIEVAEDMEVSRATLDRRLASCGLPFQKALDEARFVYFKQLLSLTHLEIGEIASMVGYASPGVLTKAFTRWTQETPMAWRRAISNTNRP